MHGRFCEFREQLIGGLRSIHETSARNAPLERAFGVAVEANDMKVQIGKTRVNSVLEFRERR